MYETFVYSFDDIFSAGSGRLAAMAAECAERLGVSGDALASLLAYRLLTDENFFSLGAENGGGHGSAAEIACADIRAVSAFYKEKSAALPVLRDYRCARERDDLAARRVKKLSRAVAELPPEKLLGALTEMYEKGGAGEIGLYTAFSARSGGELAPIADFAPASLDSLVGCEEQKAALLGNTRAFLAGKRANNVLLYGDAGTGKSTSVKALGREFADMGLKIIELRRDRLGDTEELFARLCGRSARFILFVDDLSFEESETEYKRFKALMEGGLAEAENVLLYATSNRAHLVRESVSDRDGQSIDLHRADTVEEKLSLSSRFGLTLFYPAPGQSEYLDIVHARAAAEGIDLPTAELDLRALRWATAYHKRSGRTAEQFIRSLK